MKKACLLILLAGLLSVTPSINAATIVFIATLSGANEVPPNGSPATGSGTFTLDDVANTLAVNESFSGLTAPDTAAHIHCCALPGTNTPVVLSFTAFFPTGVTAGTFNHTFTLATDLSGITVAAFISGLKSSQAYANIHDANFPGGEIRGQLIAVVPEPASLGLFAFGAGCLLIARRLRR